MQLPFFKDKKDKPEYYLALILTDEKAASIILEADLGKIKILSTNEEFFSTSVEDIPLDEFISIIDKSVSKAEEILPPDIETHKTVFGVKESWIEEETKKIKKEYLAKLKKMCDSLDLSPVGFMVTSEAIAHLLQEEEGAPLSAIVADIEKKQVTLRLLRGGKAVESNSAPLDESASATVDLLLRHFTVPVLPARIVILHTAAGEELSQQFITHQWSKSLPFLHVPQITLLPAGFDAKAVTYGAAKQMGLEVIASNAIVSEKFEATSASNAAAANVAELEDIESPDEELPDVEEAEKPKHADEEEDSPINETAAGFGFVMDQEISEVKPHSAPVHKAHHPHKEHPHKEEAAVHHHKPSYEEHHHNIKPIEELDMPEEDTPTKSSPMALLSHLLQPRLTRSPLNLFSKIKLPSFGNIQAKGNLLKFGIPAAILLLLIGAGIFYYLYQVKVQVVLTAQPKPVNQTKDVVFSTTSPSDFSKNIVAAKIVSTEVEGKLTADATGKKDIGEKAKGGMTFYNSTTKEQVITKGAVITGKNIQFTLDDTVKIASSGGASDGAKTAKGNVTAKELGKESNLPSGTKFAISGFTTSEIEGKNESAFSGGSKETVTVVSSADIEKLKKDLPKSLEDKAKEAIAQKATSSLTVLPLLTGASLSKISSDKKAGDEAKKVTVSATVSFDALGFENNELSAYSKSLLKKAYPGDVNFAEKSIDEEIKGAKEKDDEEITATIIITAGLLPKIDTGDVAQKLDGKSFTQAQEILSSLPQISDSQITFSPSIPFLPQIFPKLPKNISVVVKNK